VPTSVGFLFDVYSALKKGAIYSSEMSGSLQIQLLAVATFVSRGPGSIPGATRFSDK
jgi:hypothetical protein